MSSERVRGLGCGWPVKKAAGSGSVAGGDTRDHRYDGRRSRSRAGQSLNGSPCAVSPLRVKRGGTRGNARIDVQLRRRHGAGVTVSGGRRGSVRGRFVPEWLPPAPITKGCGGSSSQRPQRRSHDGTGPDRTEADVGQSPALTSLELGRRELRRAQDVDSTERRCRSWKPELAPARQRCRIRTLTAAHHEQVGFPNRRSG
jgi:hypothetical protein